MSDTELNRVFRLVSLYGYGLHSVNKMKGKLFGANCISNEQEAVVSEQAWLSAQRKIYGCCALITTGIDNTVINALISPPQLRIFLSSRYSLDLSQTELITTASRFSCLERKGQKQFVHLGRLLAALKSHFASMSSATRLKLLKQRYVENENEKAQRKGAISNFDFDGGSAAATIPIPDTKATMQQSFHLRTRPQPLSPQKDKILGSQAGSDTIDTTKVSPIIPLMTQRALPQSNFNNNAHDSKETSDNQHFSPEPIGEMSDELGIKMNVVRPEFHENACMISPPTRQKNLNVKSTPGRKDIDSLTLGSLFKVAGLVQKQKANHAARDAIALSLRKDRNVLGNAGSVVSKYSPNDLPLVAALTNAFGMTRYILRWRLVARIFRAMAATKVSRRSLLARFRVYGRTGQPNAQDAIQGVPCSEPGEVYQLGVWLTSYALQEALRSTFKGLPDIQEITRDELLCFDSQKKSTAPLFELAALLALSELDSKAIQLLVAARPREQLMSLSRAISSSALTPPREHGRPDTASSLPGGLSGVVAGAEDATPTTKRSCSNFRRRSSLTMVTPLQHRAALTSVLAHTSDAVLLDVLLGAAMRELGGQLPVAVVEVVMCAFCSNPDSELRMALLVHEMIIGVSIAYYAKVSELLPDVADKAEVDAKEEVNKKDVAEARTHRDDDEDFLFSQSKYFPTESEIRAVAKRHYVSLGTRFRVIEAAYSGRVEGASDFDPTVISTQEVVIPLATVPCVKLSDVLSNVASISKIGALLRQELGKILERVFTATD